MSFTIATFVEACRIARRQDEPAAAVATVVRAAVADPVAVERALAELDRGVAEKPAFHLFHCSEELTVFHVAVEAHSYGVPHDHAGWAVIGVLRGAESYNQYRCSDGSTLQHLGYDVVRAGEVRVLPADLIHDLENPSDETSSSLHVYANRFFDQPGRRIWESPDATVSAFTIDKVMAWGKATTAARRKALGIATGPDPILPDLPGARS